MAFGHAGQKMVIQTALLVRPKDVHSKGVESDVRAQARVQLSERVASIEKRGAREVHAADDG